VPAEEQIDDLGVENEIDEIVTIAITILADIRDEVRRLREELVQDDAEEEGEDLG
jgi:hypothetical protein